MVPDEKQALCIFTSNTASIDHSPSLKTQLIDYTADSHYPSLIAQQIKNYLVMMKKPEDRMAVKTGETNQEMTTGVKPLRKGKESDTSFQVTPSAPP